MDRLMSMVVVVVVAAAAIMLQSAAAQTVYVVGDSIGWTVPSNGAVAYTNWASSKTFMLGDILTFNFPTNQHNVLQVSKASFDACTSSNPIGTSISTGPANITLTSAGDHYYICTVGTHCQLGQKLYITVSGGTPGAAAPPPSTAGGPTVQSGPEQVPPPPSSSSSAVFVSFSLAMLCVAVALFL